MQALHAEHVAELVVEIAPLVAGARVVDVQGLPPRDVLLVLERADGGVRRLRVSANADGPRLHIQCGRVQRHAGPLGPFFRRLAAELAGARLATLSQVRGDRIVRLEFREAQGGGARALIAELTGRHSNLVLASGNGDVLDVLVPPPERARGEGARLVAGAPWTPPPGKPPSASGATGRETLALLLPEPPPGPPAAREAPLSWRVEAALGGLVVAEEERRARKELRERLERRLARVRSLERGLEQRRSASAGAERVFQDGELLKASLAAVRRGMRSIELADWFAEGSPPRTIELDPRRSAPENLARLFERAKKLERSSGEVEREIQLAAERRRALEEQLARVDAGDPSELAAEAVTAGLLDAPQPAPERRKAQPEPRLPYKRFHAASGAEIRVGKSARDNDALTFKHARGNDLWLHTAEAPGSHVVLRLERDVEPEREDVLDAAHLAVQFSPLKGATRADVHVARQKEVKKPRGAKPGLVVLAGGRVLHVRLEPARLRRLLSPERAGDAAPGSTPPGSA